MIHFLSITVTQKGADVDKDWRAFLNWGDSETKTCYQLRGYGQTPGEAADDAWRRYKEDRDFYADDQWEWKDSNKS